MISYTSGYGWCALEPLLGWSLGTFSRDRSIELLAQQQAGAWQYPLPDGLGSLRQWTDASSQVTYAARYAPFGGLLWQQGTAPGPWGFAGEFQDPTGLLYLRARYYDPATGRFLTRDPFPGLAALPQTQHPYVYVGNNPVNLVDPGGEIAPILVAVGIGAAIGGAGGGVGYVLAHPGGRPEDYLRSGGFWQSVGIGAASGGGVAGAVGWLVPSLLLAGGFWGSVGVGALSGSLASGAGQVTANLLTPCTPWHSGLALALATGGVTVGVAGGGGVWHWAAGTASGAGRVYDGARIPSTGVVVLYTDPSNDDCIG